ncbi:hemerythrin family non-heme iron protein, partial [Campylobacter jejuni]|nr:hemerythrin family non-heme iron protein [Campylobacter jejuni]
MDKLITWNEKYSIHDTMIDIQHQKLFELAGKVESAVYKFVKREELKEILTELFNYMKEHFDNEEQYMQEIHYPYLNEHKIMHKNIIRDMSYLIQNIKTTNDLKEKLYTIMSEWLLEHILHHDVMIGKWIKAHNKNTKEEETKQEELTEDSQEKLEFIYSCPCKTTHALSYNEHLDILYHNKNLKCK